MWYRPPRDRIASSTFGSSSESTMCPVISTYSTCGVDMVTLLRPRSVVVPLHNTRGAGDETERLPS